MSATVAGRPTSQGGAVPGNRLVHARCSPCRIASASWACAQREFETSARRMSSETFSPVDAIWSGVLPSSSRNERSTAHGNNNGASATFWK